MIHPATCTWQQAVPKPASAAPAWWPLTAGTQQESTHESQVNTEGGVWEKGGTMRSSDVGAGILVIGL